MGDLRLPPIEGNIEVCVEDGRVVIAADPQGLRALAETLLVLAKVDQEQLSSLPDGERFHMHLFPEEQLSMDSAETEICRLDAKGTGEFPKHYRPGSHA